MPDLPEVSVDVLYASRRAAISSSRSESGTVTLFVPTPQRVWQGTPVLLGIGFDDADERFALHGVVVTATQAIGRDGVGGCLVRFEGEHKTRAAEMIAFCAQRPLAMGTAMRERIPIRKTCRVKLEDRQFAGELRDLSQTGAFVVGQTSRRIKAGEHARMKVGAWLFGLGGTWLEARVIWQGEKGDQRGLGVRFTSNEMRQANTIQRLLELAGESPSANP